MGAAMIYVKECSYRTRHNHLKGWVEGGSDRGRGDVRMCQPAPSADRSAPPPPSPLIPCPSATPQRHAGAVTTSPANMPSGPQPPIASIAEASQVLNLRSSPNAPYHSPTPIPYNATPISTNTSPCSSITTDASPPSSNTLFMTTSNQPPATPLSWMTHVECRTSEVAVFLRSCIPDMQYLLNSFIQFGCHNREFLKGVAELPETDIEEFLKKAIAHTPPPHTSNFPSQMVLFLLKKHLKRSFAHAM
ncbi:hypothetical protein P691DRAFT_738546 [Macrolepiota fuliginosa MF-IS2]|uniref:Uncharacterized protein n=1 Tax=Macrolepiota fuliginosa MF-IS2 TaxID=1400762 RepID=A0A9P5X434_9AGAR|nr:hypothetical protein P691DRAFT_738546 [Macrolepiota fuliginosa MF-IS2]